MATVKTANAKWDSYVAIAEEATFGTAIADDQVFQKIDIVGGATPSFNPEYFQDNEMRNHGLNVADISDYYSTANGLWQRYTIPDFIAPSDILAKFLYGALQTVSEAATTPYLKTYTVNGAADPNFSGNAGFFFTALIKHPNASESQKLTSCVVEQLRIRFSPDQGGRAVCSAVVRTGKGFVQNANPSGANVYSTVTPPNFHDSNAATLTLNSLDLVWYNFEVVIDSRFDWLGYASGNAENYKYMGSTITATATVKYDTNSDVLLRSKASDVNAIAFTIGANSAAGYFYMESENVVLTDVTTDTGDAENVEKLNLTMEIKLKNSASEYPSFEVADAVDQSW